MRTSPAVWLLAVASWSMGGCAAPAPRFQRVVTHWGMFPLDDVLQLKVTSLGLSQVRVELRHVLSGRVLIDEVGADTRGWFFVWDDRGRLWAFWPDVGVVVWTRDPQGAFERRVITPGHGWLGDAPPEVAQHLPDWARSTLGVAADP